MDEVRGREVAARMGIKIMRTIGVLGTAFEEKIFLNPKSKMQSRYYEIPDDILVNVSMNN